MVEDKPSFGENTRCSQRTCGRRRVDRGAGTWPARRPRMKLLFQFGKPAAVNSPLRWSRVAPRFAFAEPTAGQACGMTNIRSIGGERVQCGHSAGVGFHI